MRKLFVYGVLPLVLYFGQSCVTATNVVRAEGQSREVLAVAHPGEGEDEEHAADHSVPANVNHGDEGHVDEEHAGDKHPEGVPLNFKTDLALWSLVVFIVFVLVLKKFAWGPLSDGLNKREENIRGSIREAEEARKKAEKMLAEHAKKLDSVQDEVREILAGARRDADHTKQDIVETAQREAETTRQRAVDEISRARDAALKELFDVVSTQVANATEHVLSRSLNEDDQNRLIEEALSQFPKN